MATGYVAKIERWRKDGELGPFILDPQMASILQEMSDEQLLGFEEAYKDSLEDDEIELFIYTGVVIFKRTGSVKYLIRALEKAKIWADADHEQLSSQSKEGRRRLQILTAIYVPMQLMVESKHEATKVFRSILEHHCLGPYSQASQASTSDISFSVMSPEIEDFLSGMGIEELRGLAEFDGNHSDDVKSELAIYARFAIFAMTKRIDSLEQAIEQAEKLVSSTPAHHPERTQRNKIADILLFKRYKHVEPRFGNNPGLSGKGCTYTDLPGSLVHFSAMLAARFNKTNLIEYLDRAIGAADAGVTHYFTSNDERRAGMLEQLGNHLQKRHYRTGSGADLDRAIANADMVTKITLEDTEGFLGHRLNKLAVRLNDRYCRSLKTEDLNRAIEISETLLERTPLNDDRRLDYLNNLAAHLGTRFKRTGSKSDFARSVELLEIGIKTSDNDEGSDMLNNLANLFLSSYHGTSAIEDLDKAVEWADEAFRASPRGGFQRVIFLQTLSNCLESRFERMGEMADWNRAVECIKLALDECPVDHPTRPALLKGLANCLLHRGKNIRRREADLDLAVDLLEEALELDSLSLAHRNVILVLLGRVLATRSKKSACKKDSDRAIEVTKASIEATPLDQYEEQHCGAINLGEMFEDRFRFTKSPEDFSNAVYWIESSLQWIPQDQPDLRARTLGKLGLTIGKKYIVSKQGEDRSRALACFEEALNCVTLHPSIGISLARVAGYILATEGEWKPASRYFESAVLLLPIASPRSLQRTDQQHILSECTGVAAQAAAAALLAGKPDEHALTLLELGRAIIMGWTLDMRTDIFDLEQRYPELATEFLQLRDTLDSPPSGPDLGRSLAESPLAEATMKSRRETIAKFEDVLGRIRALPEYGNFLLPASAEELNLAAAEGPVVVINASDYRCDAFIVKSDFPVTALNLPLLREEDIRRKAETLRESDPYGVRKTLEWLWEVAVCPILEALGYTGPPSGDNWPHVWWIPTGLLTHFPFHAAGRHFDSSSDNAMDRVMSSYSSSIKALLHGRRSRVKKSSAEGQTNALLVTVPGSGLQHDQAEVAMLENVCPELGLTPIKPTARRDELLKHLQQSKIFHFASHGRSNPSEPSESCLVLDEGASLTVADVRDCRLLDHTSPFLAYLSACSTKVNEDSKLADEEIHLVNAFQLAGFKHVVGTLWEVSDRHCVDVVRVLYETLRDEGMNDKAVCLGLHRAIRELRDQGMAAERARGITNWQDVEDEHTRAEAMRGRETHLRAESANGSNFRQSDWSSASDDPIDDGYSSMQRGDPLIWAAYIHSGI